MRDLTLYEWTDGSLSTVPQGYAEDSVPIPAIVGTTVAEVEADIKALYAARNTNSALRAFVVKVRRERDTSREAMEEVARNAQELIERTARERDEARAVLRDLLAWAEDSPQNRRTTKGRPCNRPWPVGRAQKFIEALGGGDD